MWAAIDTIFDCWAKMNLTERSVFWIGLAVSPLVLLAASTAGLWSGLVVLSVVFLHAAEDRQRPGYDASVHRRAFALWVKLLVAWTAPLVAHQLLTAENLVDYGLAFLWICAAGWLGVSLVLLQINPRFDYNWPPLRWFDPSVPETAKYLSRQQHPQTARSLTGR
jgi:hypothetical protein